MLNTPRVASGRCAKSSVPARPTVQKLLPPNPDRQGITIFNQGQATLYIDFGGAVSLTNFLVAIPPNGYWECPFLCTEPLWGIWDRADGQALLREFL